MARYSLFVLKVPLNRNQPANQGGRAQRSHFLRLPASMPFDVERTNSTFYSLLGMILGLAMTHTYAPTVQPKTTKFGIVTRLGYRYYRPILRSNMSRQLKGRGTSTQQFLWPRKLCRQVWQMKRMLQGGHTRWTQRLKLLTGSVTLADLGRNLKG